MQTELLTEGIIVALIALAGALGTGWFKLRSDIHNARAATRKVDQEQTATSAIARAELERLLMARIDQLQQHITTLEARVAAKDQRIAELEKRVDELESENARLKAELAQLCEEKQHGR